MTLLVAKFIKPFKNQLLQSPKKRSNESNKEQQTNQLTEQTNLNHSLNTEGNRIIRNFKIRQIKLKLVLLISRHDFT